MLLREFFSRPIEIDQNQKSKEDQSSNFEDDLFWYILDHDKLHKDYFFPIARKLKKNPECSNDLIYELFMPMVVKGCKEYYTEKKIDGHLNKKFPLEMRKDMCVRLYDHYHDDIKKNTYNIG